MPPKRQVLRGFPQEVLAKMTPPFIVRAEMIKFGDQKQPVILPPTGPDGPPPGTNLSFEELRTFDQYLLQLNGTGQYEITATDAKGESQTWQILWPSTTQIPPVATPPPPSAPLGWSPPPPVAPPAPSNGFGAGFGVPSGLGVIPQPTQPAWSPAAMNPFWNPPPYSPYGQNSYGQTPYGQPPQYPLGQTIYPSRRESEDRTRQLEEQLRAMQEESRRAREQQLAAEHKAEREKLEADHRAAQSAFAQQLKEMQQRMESTQTRRDPQVDEQIRAMREENQRLRDESEKRNAALEQQLRDTKIQQDAEKRESLLREEIRAQRENTEKLILELKNSNRPDPMAEALKEQARLSANAQEKTNDLIRQLVERSSPAAMESFLRLARDQGGALDTMRSAFGSLFELQQKVVDNVMANQGGSPSVAQEAIGAANNLASKIAEGLAARAIEEQRTKQMAARAEMENARAAQMSMAQSAAQAQLPPGQAPSAGLGNAKPQAAPPPTQPAPKPEPRVILLPQDRAATDLDWFGGIKELMDAVVDLRANIDGKGAKLSPQIAMSLVFTGLDKVKEQNLTVPIEALLVDQRTFDFVQRLIPEASFNYKAACVDVVEKIIKGAGLPPESAPTPAAATANTDALGNDEEDENGEEE